jgi:hypothetical protein
MKLGYEAWPFSIREEHILELTEKNRMVRRIFDSVDPVQCTYRVVKKTACSNSKFYNLQPTFICTVFIPTPAQQSYTKV